MIRRLAVLGALVVGGVLAAAGPASAHPTDEIVQQVYVTPARSGLTVELDITPGVLVASGFAGSLDLDHDGVLGPGEISTHVAAVEAAVQVQVDGEAVDLQPTDVSYPPLDVLAAGADAVRLTWTGVLPSDARDLRIHDGYDPGAVPKVQMSVLVAPDPVPLGAIAHADRNRSLTVAFDAGGAATPEPAPSTGAWALDASMLDSVRHPLTSPWAVIGLLGVCVLLGSLHALTPGHGKALLAAYLVGDGGTVRQAIGLGVAITVTHTAAVLALGAAVLVAGEHLVPATVVPVLTVAAGVLVLALGIRLIRARWPLRRPVAHGHGHAHGHPAGVTGVRGVLAMGFSAGLVPCPEALSVMLLAVGLNRTALGLVMITAFSFGLAGILVGLGLLLVRGAPLLTRVAGRGPVRLGRWIPLASASVVTVLGGAMAATGVTGLLSG